MNSRLGFSVQTKERTNLKLENLTYPEAWKNRSNQFEPGSEDRRNLTCSTHLYAKIELSFTGLERRACFGTKPVTRHGGGGGRKRKEHARRQREGDVLRGFLIKPNTYIYYFENQKEKNKVRDRKKIGLIRSWHHNRENPSVLLPLTGKRSCPWYFCTVLAAVRIWNASLTCTPDSANRRQGYLRQKWWKAQRAFFCPKARVCQSRVSWP